MHFLLTPVGSSGDVHPYIGLGDRLRHRGHDVTVLTAEPHRAVVEGAGLAFVPTFTTEAYNAATLNPDLWHPRRGFGKVMLLTFAGLEPTWKALEERAVPGKSFLVGHPLGFAGRSFEEKTGIPAATVHLAPSSLRSAHQVPVLPPATDVSRLPHAAKRALWYLVDRGMIDPVISPVFDRWRASHGLPPVRRYFHSWINSPRRVIAFFPEWYGPRQPDWPERLDFTSFPLWDAPGSAPVDPELERFLAAGTPPVVATPGTANRHAARFFAVVLQALTRLGRRGLFLTGFPEQLPPDLPPTILARRYAPLSAVLPRAAALIHHGGIGTAAQGLAAGVPQLVMSMAFDQPDNAARAVRLGVARWLVAERFTADRVEEALGGLLTDPGVARATAECRERVRAADGIGLACDVLEGEASRTDRRVHL
jgi:UDP:flavonoid glycosyltransferase YjiC (YdhE family)